MKLSAIVVLAGLALAACSSAAPPPADTGPVVHQAAATPPPVTTTPVPIVHARTVPGSGRTDPFVALFGPPTGAESAPTPSHVAVSSFPNIPTLPGFENAPGAVSLWTGVRLTGILEHGGYVAIVDDNGKTYFVRSGDRIDDKFTVLSIGPDYITLASEKEERHFTLGG